MIDNRIDMNNWARYEIDIIEDIINEIINSDDIKDSNIIYFNGMGEFGAIQDSEDPYQLEKIGDDFIISII